MTTNEAIDDLCRKLGSSRTGRRATWREASADAHMQAAWRDWCMQAQEPIARMLNERIAHLCACTKSWPQSAEGAEVRTLLTICGQIEGAIAQQWTRHCKREVPITAATDVARNKLNDCATAVHATATAWLDNIAPQRAIAYKHIARFRAKAENGVQCDISPKRLANIGSIDNQTFTKALAQQPMWLLGASLSGADNKTIDGCHAQLIMRCASERARQRGIKLADIDAQALQHGTEQWAFDRIEPPLVALSHWVKMRGERGLNEELWAAMVQAEHHWTNRASGGGRAPTDAVAEIEGWAGKTRKELDEVVEWKCLRNLERTHKGPRRMPAQARATLERMQHQWGMENALPRRRTPARLGHVDDDAEIGWIIVLDTAERVLWACEQPSLMVQWWTMASSARMRIDAQGGSPGRPAMKRRRKTPSARAQAAITRVKDSADP